MESQVTSRRAAQGRRLALAAAMGFACLAAQAGPQTGDWLELVDTSRLPVLRDDICRQVSSYDHLGGNNDGFLGTHSYLRREDGAFVLFEDEGPGCVYRIWSANPGLNPIEFYFDGETTPRLVFRNWLEMFLDQREPFVRPLSMVSLGGCVSYVPLPYASSLKIVTRLRPKFYQITYQKFADGADVRTFDPALSAETRARFERARDAWKHPGEDPWPEGAATTEAASITIPAGATVSLFALTGPAVLHSLVLDLGGLDRRAMELVRLVVQADGAASQVDCPVDAFFLWGPGPGGHKSLLAGQLDSGAFYSYWPMPCAESLEVLLVNENPEPFEVQWAESHRNTSSEALAAMGRFHAEYVAPAETRLFQPYPLLERSGRGHWCGTFLIMRGDGLLPRFLEGDEMARIDGRKGAQYHGTGTEDYFNGGWYFGGTGWYPLWGCTRFRPFHGQCDAYRLHLTDPVPFQESASITIEHGNLNLVPARYGRVSFFYAEP